MSQRLERDAKTYPCFKSQALLELMIKSGIIDEDIGKALSAYQERWNVTCLQTILDTHTLTETQVADKIAQLMKVTRIIDLLELKHDPQIVRRLPFDLARQFEAVVINQDEYDPDSIMVVIADPTMTDCVNKIKELVVSRIVLGVAERSDILRAIHEFYELQDQLPTLMETS